jgi:hypothetical protein
MTITSCFFFSSAEIVKLDSKPLCSSFVKWTVDLFNQPETQAFLDEIFTHEIGSYQSLTDELKKLLNKIKGGTFNSFIAFFGDIDSCCWVRVFHLHLHSVFEPSR